MRLLVAASLSVFMSVPVGAEQPSTADLILIHGKIWTGNRGQLEAEGLAVRGEHIVAVGKVSQIQRLSGPKTRSVDLQGKRVVPGFYDSHVHLLSGGLQLSRVPLRDCRDEGEFGRRLQEFDRKLARNRWLLGGDWDHDHTFGGRLPSSELLDKYVPDRLVFLHRYDGHMAVVNRKTLKIAGITAKTADPAGGVIFRRAGTQEPTGVLRDNAMDLVRRLVPAATDDEMAEAIRAALAEARKVGVTSVQDMDGSDADTRLRLFRLYQRLARSGQLSLRIDLRWPLTEWKSLADLIAKEGMGDHWVRLGGVKGFIDGSLGSSTAKMFQPYLHEPGNTGVYVTPLTRLHADIRAADKAGLSVAVHAIGDRGNAELLDILAEVSKENGPRDRRFRIEHAQHLRADDYRRFRDLGVVPSMQPYHLIDDGRWAEGRIGLRRCASSYAYRSLLDTRARVAMGSDWPVAPLDPLLGIDAAVRRRTLDGKHPEGWFPEQKIHVHEALEGYTLSSAFAGFEEKERGSLEAGKLADLVVLSRDILAPAKDDRWADAKAVFTMIGGQIVFEATK